MSRSDTHTRIRFSVKGDHVHTRWYSARNSISTHGMNGELTFTLDEWEMVKMALQQYPGNFELLDNAQLERKP